MINSKQFLNGLSHQLGVITPDFLPIYSFFSQKRIVPKDNYSFACEAKGIGKKRQYTNLYFKMYRILSLSIIFLHLFLHKNINLLNLVV